jgi:hypothetical protein
MNRKQLLIVGIAVAVLFCAGCSPKIYGTVELIDPNDKPVADESPQGTVINMINTSEKVEKASHSTVVNEEGEFESEKEAITPGTWKVEAARIGYNTETQTVEIGGSTRKKLSFRLKQIEEAQRRTIEGSATDADKIINPGEVNIQPPGM